MTGQHYDTDPRRAWRQWCRASAQWQERWERFVQHQAQAPLPLGAGLSRRALSRALMAQHAARQALWATRPAFPEICRALPCGATTRQGTPCQRRDLYASGRCRLHGGLSTGPRTAEGKQRAARNGWHPKRKRTP